MTEREAAIRRSVTVVETAFPSGTGGWARKRFELWVDVVIDVDPDAVSNAATDLVREWSDDRGRAPQPGHLRDRALSHQRRIHSERQTRRILDAPPPQRTPAWWARLIQGALCASMEDRGETRTWNETAELYADIARRHGLRPDSFLFGPGNEHRFTAMDEKGNPLDGMTPSNHSVDIAEAVSEARALGERLAEGEADGRILAEMIGAARGAGEP